MTTTTRTILALAGALALVTLLPATAMASVASQQIPGESNLPFLLVGFALAWAIFFVYAFYVARKNRELKREIDDLRASLSDRS